MNENDVPKVADLQRQIEALRQACDELEVKVQQRTAELAKANEALRAEIAGRQQTEEALRAAEERYRTISEVISDFAYSYRVEPNGALATEWITAESVYRMMGFTVEELEARGDLMSFVHPDDLPLARQRMQTLISGGQPDVGEYRVVAKSGEVRWLCNYVRPVWDEAQGRVVRIIGAGQDITERKRAEAALRESEEQFRLLYEQAPLGYHSLNEDGYLIEVNQAWLDMLKYSRDQVVGRWFGDFLAPHEVERFRQRFSQLKATGQTHAEYEMVRGDGSIIIVEVDGKVRHDERGRFKQTHCILYNITERKQVEQALRESEQFNKAIISSAGEGIIVYDSALRYVMWNRFMEGLTGTPADQVLGRHALDVFPHLREQGIDILLQRALAGETLSSSDTPYYVPWTGKSGWVQGTYGPYRNANGDIVGVVGSVHDITKRKQTEQSLARRVAQLAFINDVGQKIAAALDLDEILNRAARLIHESFGYYHVALFTVDRQQGEMVMTAKASDLVLFPPEHQMKLGQGMVGWVGLHGERLLANDVRAEPHYINFYPDLITTQSELSVPIRAGQEIIGVLDLQSPRLNAFDENDVIVMETLADQIAVAIQNARLYESIQRELVERRRAEETLQQRNRELALLYRASQIFNSTLDLDQVLAAVLDEVRRSLEVTACSAWLIDPATGGLVCRQATGPQSETVRGWRLAPGQGLAGWVARRGESLNVPDALSDERYFNGVDQQTGLALRSILTVPLRARQEVIGVIQVVDTTVGRFAATDLGLVESLAATAAIAVENARLYEQARQDAQTKSALLHEVNHRVKNNLAAIIGVLYAERRHAGIENQPIYQSIMQDLTNRVHGLATVHAMLSASEWSPLSLCELTERVIQSSLQMLPPDKHILVNVSPSPVRVTHDRAHNLALVINELATNTIRHALQERATARLAVSITSEGDMVQFELRDDGPGYPEEVLRLERRNVGFELIQAIVCGTLRGELSLRNDHGAVAVIRFKAQA